MITTVVGNLIVADDGEEIDGIEGAMMVPRQVTTVTDPVIAVRQVGTSLLLAVIFGSSYRSSMAEDHGSLGGPIFRTALLIINGTNVTS